MPLVAFQSLPDDARVWVFGSSEDLAPEAERVLLDSVDEYLSNWRAHGSPLTAARDWRDRRFLAIGLDQRDENASGCSLDALFRILRELEPRIGATLLGNARVYYRPTDDTIGVTDRAGFAVLAENGSITADSCVFDTSVQTAEDWRSSFEVQASGSWHRALLPTTE